MRGTGFTLCALLCISAAGCSGDLAVSDTGYTGTWSRGNERVTSIVAIARVGDEHRFRWRKVSEDGKFEVRCDWDGNCAERIDGKKIAEHTFKTWKDPRSGHLMVEGREKRLEPDVHEVRYLDELVLEPGGRVLWSYTIERGGQTFEGADRPQRSFTKVSDAVSDPPPGASP